jgi:hypothetical protein
LGIRSGSQVDFVERANGAVELVPSVEGTMREQVLLRSLDDWFKRVEGTGDSGLSADEIMALTRDRDERNDH